MYIVRFYKNGKNLPLHHSDSESKVQFSEMNWDCNILSVKKEFW